MVRLSKVDAFGSIYHVLHNITRPCRSLVGRLDCILLKDFDIPVGMFPTFFGKGNCDGQGEKTSPTKGCRTYVAEF